MIWFHKQKKRNFSYLSLLLGLLFILVSTVVFADSNDGAYKGNMSSSDCGSGVLSVVLANGNLTGTMVQSGTTYSMTGAVSGATIDFHAPGNVFFYAGNIGNGMITGNYMAHNGSVCSGVSFSLTRTDASTGSSSLTNKEISAIQDLNDRKKITNQIVNDVFVNTTPTLEPENMEVTPSVTATSSYKYFNIPLSYAFSERLKFSAELPVIYVDENFYSGNLAVQGTQYSKSSNNQHRVLTTVQLTLPTGDAKIGEGGFEFFASQARVMKMKDSRVFVSYGYRHTTEANDLDTGNTINGALGMDYPLEGYTFYDIDKAYGLITGQSVSESQYDGVGLDDQRLLLDATIGLIWAKYNIRFGLSVPIFTVSESLDNSDRLLSLDIGYQWGI